MPLKSNPPFVAPAAPLGAGATEVFAQRDVFAERNGKQILVHKRGSAQTLEPAVAREVIAGNPDDYGYAAPDAEPESASTHPQTGEPTAPGAHPSPINAMLQPTSPHPDVDPEAPGTVETGSSDAPAPPPPGSGVPTDGGGEFNLADVPGVGDKLARTMADAGYGTREKLSAASVEDLQKVPGVGAKLAEKILDHVNGKG